MTKINVISGFLGAGKTTLISKLIKDVFHGQKVVLVENEFGEIGIDGGFLKDSGIEISEINSGCICCTLKGDFEKSLAEVISTYNPDRIIIEPSGVGKLSDILDIVKNVEGTEIETYSTIVYAKRCKTYHKNFKEFFDDQISSASCVILSRSQMVKDEMIQRDVDIIHELNEEARIITTPWDELSGQAIYDAMVGAMPESLIDEEEHHEHHHDHEEGCCCCGHDHDHEHHHDHEEGCCCHEHDHEHEHHHDHEEGCSCGHDQDHEHHHEHGEGCSCGHHHHHADEVFNSIGLETIKHFTQAELEEILGKLGDNIVRAKGIVQGEDDAWLFFDYVPGDVDIRKGSAAYTGLITVIGEHVSEEEIKALFGI